MHIVGSSGRGPVEPTSEPRKHERKPGTGSRPRLSRGTPCPGSRDRDPRDLPPPDAPGLLRRQRPRLPHLARSPVRRERRLLVGLAELGPGRPAEPAGPGAPLRHRSSRACPRRRRVGLRERVLRPGCGPMGGGRVHGDLLRPAFRWRPRGAVRGGAAHGECLLGRTLLRGRAVRLDLHPLGLGDLVLPRGALRPRDPVRNADYLCSPGRGRR